MTFERAGQSSGSLPFRLLCVSTETNVSRDSGLSGVHWGAEHPSSASHRQTTRGAVPRLHNLGQSHPEEGCRRHRPACILTSSRSRSILLLLRLQLLQVQWIPLRLRRQQIHEVLTSTLDDGSLLLYVNITAPSISERLPPPLPPAPPLSASANSPLYRSISVFLWCSHKFPLHCSVFLSLPLFPSNSQLCLSALLSLCPEDVEHVFRVGVGGLLTS